jgi:hypothetical protein
MSPAIVAGSVASAAAVKGVPLAEALLDVESLILLDCSGSMATADSRGSRRRIDSAREELATLQRDLPGKLALVCFAGHAQLMWGGVPPEPMGGTDLAGALAFAKTFDQGGMRFVVVSDGEPDDQAKALATARGFAGPISTVFVGPEGGPGAAFLRRLATASGGRHATADRVRELADVVKPLLTA